MKKFLIIMMTLALLSFAGVMNTEAALSDSIAVTVTMQDISVSLDVATWIIGPIIEGGTTTQAVVATNDGNVNEDLAISVDDSASTWTAGSVAGNEIFLMEFDLPPILFPGTEITTVGVPLVNGLAPGTQDFTLQFTAPTPTAVGTTPQSLTVTVSAAAS